MQDVLWIARDNGAQVGRYNGYNMEILRIWG